MRSENGRTPGGARRRVLVIGGTGFIGTWLCRELVGRGHDVVAVSRYGPRAEWAAIVGERRPALELVDGSRERLAAVVREHRPDAVVHLDASTDPVALRAEPRRALDENVVVSLDVMRLCQEVGARLVLASSVAVLPTIVREPVDAAHPVILADQGPGGGFYGASKLAVEAFGLAYAEAFGLDVRIVRPSAVFGFGMQRPIGIRDVVEGAVRGEEVTVYLDAPRRDYTPVEDVASVFAELALRDVVGQRVYYAGTGRRPVDGPAMLAAVRAAFPDARVRTSDEPLDPTGIESRYRGTLDMAPVRQGLGLLPHHASFVDALVAYAGRYRDWLAAHPGTA